MKTLTCYIAAAMLCASAVRAAEPPAPSAVDFRYSPPQWQAAICLPDDPCKSLVDKDGALLYHFNRVRARVRHARRRGDKQRGSLAETGTALAARARRQDLSDRAGIGNRRGSVCGDRPSRVESEPIGGPALRARCPTLRTTSALHDACTQDRKGRRDPCPRHQQRQGTAHAPAAVDRGYEVDDAPRRATHCR